MSTPHPSGFICVLQVRSEKNKILGVLVSRYQQGTPWLLDREKMFLAPHPKMPSTVPLDRIFSANDLREALLAYIPETDSVLFRSMGDFLLMLKKGALKDFDFLGRVFDMTSIEAFGWNEAFRSLVSQIGAD